MKRKANAIPALFLIIPSLLLGLEIKGRVLSWDRKPLEGALVQDLISGKSCFTDQHGKFRIEIKTEKGIELKISHPGYLEEKIFIKENIPKFVEVFLKPRFVFHEQINVSALRYGEKAAAVPAAEKTIEKTEIHESLPATIAEALERETGLSAIGIGGFNKVPAVRGLARRRSVIIIDNVKITSDRRTGPDASFFSPFLIEQIEVVRSGSSVFYGSEAIGGIIRIFSALPKLKKGIRTDLISSFETVNRARNFVLTGEYGFGKSAVLLSFSSIKADDYSSPEGKVTMSRFNNLSTMIKYFLKKEDSKLQVSLFASRGYNIGKPAINSDKKPTWYPEENHYIFQLSYEKERILKDATMNFSLFLHPSSRQTRRDVFKDYKVREEFSRISRYDVGGSLSFKKRFPSNILLQAGMDYFATEGMEAEINYQYFDSSGNLTSQLNYNPLSDGSRRELGCFLTADYEKVFFDVVAGLRSDLIFSKAYSSLLQEERSSSHKVITGFAGVTFKLSSSWKIFATVSRAYRAPSLSELFYTGLTGRRYVVSNPELSPEHSINLDWGMKFSSKKLFIGFYLFRNHIYDMIERFFVPEGDYYTYNNIEEGRIQGLETEIELLPFAGMRLFSSFIYYTGQSLKKGQRLNDIPPPRLASGFYWVISPAWLRFEVIKQWKMKDVGPAEEPIDGFILLNLRGGVEISSKVTALLKMSNILNIAYKSRPDPDAPLEPGRSISLAVKLSL